ncbi:hypothetical protein JTF08_13785 [Micrococcaceae bacterium RIT802]|nr:hypothetical protein [Micrococcaceae bacterium RIT 802]
MPIKTEIMRNAVVAGPGYGPMATHGALYTTSPGATAPSEPVGASYARQPLTWGAPSNGVIQAVATFTVPAGNEIVGQGVHDALTAGNYLDGEDTTAQVFSIEGTVTITFFAAAP